VYLSHTSPEHYWSSSLQLWLIIFGCWFYLMTQMQTKVINTNWKLAVVQSSWLVTSFSVCGCLVSRSGKSTWDLRWRMWYQDRFSSEFFSFHLLASLHHYSVFIHVSSGGSTMGSLATTAPNRHCHPPSWQWIKWLITNNTNLNIQDYHTIQRRWRAHMKYNGAMTSNTKLMYSEKNASAITNPTCEV
jgi:hypothetical protein